ncbi:MAG: hypothetical protein ACPGXY_03080 [Alphaproteobacteria bacterium]
MKTLIPALRPGTLTDSSGRKHVFTREDVKAIAERYDPALFESPLVFGHPKSNDPAHGWGRYFFDEVSGQMMMAVENISKHAKKALKDKAFKKVSSSFFMPNDPSNPTPGKMYVRHTGLLGAKAPADPKLGVVEFNNNHEYLEFTMAKDKALEDIEKQGQTFATAFLNTITPAFMKKQEENEADFSEQNTALKDENRKLKEQIEASQKEGSEARVASFCESLLKSGVEAAHRPMLERVFGALEAAPAEFSSAEGKGVAQELSDFISSYKPLDFSEKDNAESDNVANFSATRGYNVSEENQKRYDQVMAHAKKNSC